MIDINLDFAHNGVFIKDHFMWDLTNPNNCPDEFAAQLIADTKLSTQLVPMISLQIRR